MVRVIETFIKHYAKYYTIVEFNFGTRNLMAMGYTRYVALPSSWVKANNLRDGGQVGIVMDNDGRLIVSAVDLKVCEESKIEFEGR